VNIAPRLILTSLFLAASDLSAATRYVSLASTNPTPPYTNWMMAATSIQPAVGAAAAGDVILVTNGLYAGGVSVTKPLTLLSVNGPQFTVIDGGGTSRCVYLAGGGSLTGLTLTNGMAPDTGRYPPNQGAGVWCASTNTFLTNCVITGNLTTDPYGSGGGVSGGTLYDCALSGNYSSDSGGGASQCTLYNCSLTDNSAGDSGGGAELCTLYNCTLTGNSAGSFGGGADWCTLYNCTLNLNSANNGGGEAGSTNFNCTLTGNSAGQGGAAWGGAFYNCIAYFNKALSGGANYDSKFATLNYCCTVPLPAGGTGNIVLDPQLASATYLSADSPCRGAGSTAYATGTDIDGEAWGNPPSMGCDEYHAGALTGPLTLSVMADHTNAAVGSAVGLTAVIEGRTTGSAWEFGDGVVVSNRPYASHAWTKPGDYTVVCRAYNEILPGGVTTSVSIHVESQVLHVAVTSTNPQPPYASWATAATNIQQAVDAAGPGTQIVVADGVYPGGLSVNTPLALRSVNGPQLTTINGGGTNRCVSLTDGTSLTGFTLTNGMAESGGGVFCTSTNAFLTNCVITGNSVYSGGWPGRYGAGVCGGTLCDCTVVGNSSSAGAGGASGSTLYNCRLIDNSAAAYDGGGALYCTLDNCTLSGNSAPYGGGAAYSTLYHCTLTANSATYGGGALNSTLYNCALSANSVHSVSFDGPGYFLTGSGGGANGSTLYNCTLTGNSAPDSGGAASSTLYNCIVYFNTASLAGANYNSSSTLNYCCTTPLPAGGTGNITHDPQLASADHLSAGSPCRGAGSAAYSTGSDIDGELWGNPPSIGCDEYQRGAVTGPLTVSLVADYTNVVVGYPLNLTALIEGRTTGSMWDFGDGVVVSNQPYASHAWTIPGDYQAVLRASNEGQLGGAATNVTIHVVKQPALYVAAGSTNPLPPYVSWATAATGIQDAVDATTVAGALVVVTNGAYAGGLAVDTPLALRSVNGPQFTVIDGGGTNQCARLTTGASLTGFTLTNGFASGLGTFGGGVCCASPNAFVTNCVIVGNFVNDSGGGAYGCTLYNCTLAGNAAAWVGGGAVECTFYNCTLTTNWAAVWGGGVLGSMLSNCTLADNSAPDWYGGGAVECTLYNCTLAGNSAMYGGGAAWSTLYNCILASNLAADFGGGAYAGTLYNCTLTGNTAHWGGGADSSHLNNCILYFNTAQTGANFYTNGSTTLSYCCITPMPTNGVGNITNAPQFFDYGKGNLRLQSNSPCINAGNNTYASGATDLDGNPRIVSATVDIGAYEYQGVGSVISYAWLQQYGLPTDGSADYADPDHDGLNDWQEWTCGTDPTNALSALRMVSATPVGTNATVTWHSVAGVSYFLERSTNLLAKPSFSLLVTNLPGQPGTTSFTDTSTAGPSLFYYRVGVGQ